MPETPTYSTWKTLWKGLQPALVTAGVAIFAVFADLVSADAVAELGVPTFIATFVVMALKNWAKNRNLGKDWVGPR